MVTDIEIVSANGQRVYSTRENNHFDVEIDLPRLTPGVPHTVEARCESQGFKTRCNAIMML